ncbi:MAG TPA: Smr/MutS family protein, partial [Candidatus Polarisedimenticolaceae bacterium]|nr:Smr/MutS family protein [Candidatus Polarisedimenticolaceae bacterium]
APAGQGAARCACGATRGRSPVSEPPEEVRLPIEDRLDLHAFRPADVRSVVESYLEAAQAQGLREVRLIHGRGLGVQREIVRSLLARHPAVLEFRDAPPERGGWGATLVWLTPRPDGPTMPGG